MILSYFFGSSIELIRKQPENSPIRVGPKPDNKDGNFSDDPKAKIISPIKYRLNPTINEEEIIPN